VPALGADRDALARLLLDAYLGGCHYFDPVVTSPARKRQGLGTAAVCESLRRLHRDGVGEVGAVITDGNVASERLFGRLGFARVGPWPRA